MQPKRFIPHAPPCSLKDVLSADLDVAQLGAIVAALPGAIEHGTKANEQWRYLLRNCWVLGYRYSAVVAGDHPQLIPLVAAAVRAAVVGNYQAPVLDISQPVADDAIEQRVSTIVEIGATWEPALDWTGEPWADAWIAHCRSQQRLARTFQERVDQPLDPYAWALAHGYIS